MFYKEFFIYKNKQRRQGDETYNEQLFWKDNFLGAFGANKNLPFSYFEAISNLFIFPLFHLGTSKDHVLWI